MMEQPDPSPAPAQLEPATAAVPWQLHARLVGEEGPAGVLDVVASAGRPLGLAYFTACLLRDPISGGWYTTALLDPLGRPADFAAFRVPAGPFRFSPPATVELQPLSAVLGAAWGPDACARIERSLGAAVTLCLPIPGGEEAHGALVTIAQSEQYPPDLIGLVAHAVSVISHQVDLERATASDDLLDGRRFLRRAGDEVARAERFGRLLTMVGIQVNDLADLPTLTAAIKASLQRGDFGGRPDVQGRTLVVGLPECSAQAWRAMPLVESAVQAGFFVGHATLPDDGRGLRRLLEIVEDRCQRARFRATTPLGAPVIVPAAGRRPLAGREPSTVGTLSREYFPTHGQAADGAGAAPGLGQAKAAGSSWVGFDPLEVAAEVRRLLGARGAAPPGAAPVNSRAPSSGPRQEPEPRGLPPASPPQAQRTAVERPPRPSERPSSPARPSSASHPRDGTPNPNGALPPEFSRTRQRPAAVPARVNGHAGVHPAPGAGAMNAWTQGRSGRQGEDVTFYPRCMVAFCRRTGPEEDDRTMEQARIAAAAQLRRDCPTHDAAMAIGAGEALATQA